jgi:hypothetical protein
VLWAQKERPIFGDRRNTLSNKGFEIIVVAAPSRQRCAQWPFFR